MIKQVGIWNEWKQTDNTKKYTFTSAVNDERVQDDTGQKFSYLIG